MLFFDPLYLLLVGPALALSIVAQVRVKSTFARFSRTATLRGMSGAEAAQAILQGHGIGHVGVRRASGFLSDHYDP
ncbi:MAG: zinc metallopeptidase, partial [Candidatus Eisenbacteria bacterium]|nr:zinc metallopeptidase [Candidatus Eisenbacteria bacterium]